MPNLVLFILFCFALPVSVLAQTEAPVTNPQLLQNPGLPDGLRHLVFRLQIMGFIISAAPLTALRSQTNSLFIFPPTTAISYM
jgi:hypothetical protein